MEASLECFRAGTGVSRQFPPSQASLLSPLSTVAWRVCERGSCGADEKVLVAWMPARLQLPRTEDGHLVGQKAPGEARLDSVGL